MKTALIFSLLAAVYTFAQMPPAPPAIVGQPRTNAYYFAATSYDSVGLESAQSQECAVAVPVGGTNPAVTSISLAWTDPDPRIAGFHLYEGATSHVYTTMIDAGLASNFTFALVKPVTNGQTWFVQESTNLTSWYPSPTITNVIRTTNGQGPPQRWFRMAAQNWSL